MELAVAAAAAKIVGAGLAAYGSYSAGKQQQKMMRFEAQGLEQKAGQEAAAAQHRAEIERLKADRLISQQNATLAASGAGVTGGAIDIMSEARRQGELNAQIAVYEGSERARGLRTEASTRRVAGDAAMRGSKLSAISSFITGVGSALSGASTSSPSREAYYAPRGDSFGPSRGSDGFDYYDNDPARRAYG